MVTTMKHQQSDKPKVINKPSELLTHDENEVVFSLLGRPCKTMATAVVQLFTTEPPAHSIWIKRHTGIACFVRDHSKRSYYIRVYCLLINELIWEQEMYDSIIINKSKEFLIDFEGGDRMVAINFASENEAANFYSVVTTTIANRNKRRATNKRRSRRTPPPTPDTHSHTIENGLENILSNKGNTAPVHNMSQVPLPTMPTFSQYEKKDRKRTNRRFTKADISMPTDFKHIAHVGWTEQKGFDLIGEDVDSLNTFLVKAGVSERQLEDRDTRAFIYDFIQSNNVLDSVKSEQVQGVKQHTPPPVPSRHHNGTQRTAPPPPPPPTRQPPPPVPKTTPPRTVPPGRPPPISIPVPSSAPAPPPPPPPPPPIGHIPVAPPPPPPGLSSVDSATVAAAAASSAPTAPMVNDVRSALMDSIRKGAVLKKVPDPTTLSTGSGSGGDSRSDLLSEIRQGVELRPAADRELGAQRETNGTDALADALRRALIERGRVLRSSDEDSDESDDGEWDD